MEVPWGGGTTNGMSVSACVSACVCVHAFGRVAHDDGVCLARWLSNNQVKCPIMSIP